MALPELRQSEELAPIATYLAARGIRPNSAGEYDERSVQRVVLDAIRERGLDPDLVFDETTEEWTVEVRDQRTPTDPRMAIAWDTDRTTALLQALRLALTWPTPEEFQALFDDYARSLIGMDGASFLEKWQAGGLSAEDPAVVHLLMMRPRGR